MKRTRGLLLITLVATSVLVAIPPFLRESQSVARAEGNAPSMDAPTVASLAPLRDGFKWGRTHVDITNTFNKNGGLIDQDYDPLLRHAQPGVQQQSLEADRDNKKAAIERSYLRFVTPTGYDSTGISHEYSYRNNEAILLVERQGKKRYVFFMGTEPGERLWKIYDEIPLAAGGPLGATFAEAVTRVQGILGVAGRARPQDAASGVAFTTVDLAGRDDTPPGSRPGEEPRWRRSRGARDVERATAAPLQQGRRPHGNGSVHRRGHPGRDQRPESSRHGPLRERCSGKTEEEVANADALQRALERVQSEVSRPGSGAPHSDEALLLPAPRLLSAKAFLLRKGGPFSRVKGPLSGRERERVP